MSQRRIRRGANEEQDAAQLKLGEGNARDHVGHLVKVSPLIICNLATYLPNLRHLI